MKKFVSRRLLPFILTIIMIFSAAVPALAAVVKKEADVPIIEGGESAQNTPTDPGALISGKLEGGVYTLNLNAEALYEIIKDKSITKDELMQFIPEEALNALKNGDSREALAELAANFITADDLAEFIAILPTEVLSDHVDLDFIFKFVTVKELFTVVSVDEMFADIPEEDIAALVNDEALEVLLNDNWSEYDNFSDLVHAAGGYSPLLSTYSVDEIKDFVDAIGFKKLKTFLTDNGAFKKIDVKRLAKDIVSLAKDKKDELKPALREVFNLITRILNSEFSTISINDTVIYKYGSFFIEKMIYAIANEIPDIQKVLEMKSGDTLAGFVISAPLRESTFSLGVKVNLVGDLTDLQDFLELHKDIFNFDIDEELNATVELGLPEVVTALYEKAIVSERIPETIRTKLLELGTMTVEDIAEFLNSIPDEDLEKLASVFAEKANAIRDKAYSIIDSKASGIAAVAKAKAVADKVIDAVSDPKSLDSLLSKVSDKLISNNPISGVKLFSFYDGNGSFIFTKTAEVDLYKLISKVVTLPEDVLILFGNDMTVSYSVTATLSIPEMYKVTVIEKDFSKKEFFIPAGTDLGILKEHGLTDANLEGKIMPSEDCTFMDEDILSISFVDEQGNEIAKFFYSTLTPPTESLFPAAPEKEGYTAAWGEYELYVEKDLIVSPVYTPIDYDFGYSNNGVYTFVESININTEALHLPDSVVSAIEGYAFDYWFLDVNGNGELDDGDFILEKVSDGVYKIPEGKTLPLGDLVAYAVFKPIEYKVYFYVNGELYGEPLVFTVENRGFVLPATPVIPSGYQFEYWEADLDGDGVYTEITSGTILPLGDVEVRAKFNENTYAVLIKVDGVTSVMPGGISINSTCVYLPIPEKLYHTFKEYYLEGNSSIVLTKTDDYKTVDGVTYYRFDLPDNFVFTEASVCFVAEFTAIEYDFGYSAHGEYTYSHKISANTEVLYLPDGATPLTGYKFNCWYLDINGNGALDDGDIILEKVSDGVYKVPAGKTLPLGDALVAYADFDPIEYKVYFYVNGEIVSEKTFTVEDNELILPATPADPFGYHFDGWYADLDGDGVAELVTNGMILPLGDVRVDAKFSENEYEVYMNVDGVKTPMPDGITISSEYVYLPIPEKNHYTYVNFFLDTNTGVVLIRTNDYKVVNGVRYYKYELPDNYTFTEGSVSFSAEFTPTEYSFGYYADGNYTPIGSINIEAELFVLPDSVLSTNVGYRFSFWYIDVNKNGAYDGGDILLEKSASGDGYNVPENFADYLEDLTIRADFQPIKYTVYFYVNGGEYYSYVFDVNGRGLALPTAPSSALGYTFDGWYADLDGDGSAEKVTAGDILPLGDVQIEARFNENEYKVSTKVDGATTVMPDGISVNSTSVYLPLPEKNYHTFAGYYLEGSESVVLIKTNEYKVVNGVTYYRFDLPENFVFTESAVCFVAEFTPVEYEFGYSANGQYTEVGTVNVNTTVLSLPDSVISDTAGYEFDFWYIDVNKNGVYDENDIKLEKVSDCVYKVPEGKTIPLGDDLVAYAAFKPIKYTVYFYVNGEEYSSYVFDVNSRGIILANAPTNPLGYKFDYWEADLDGDGEYERIYDGTLLPLGDVQVRARFNESEYSVFVKVDGETTLMPDGISVNSTYVYLSIPEKLYHSFTKYYLEGNPSVVLIKTGDYKTVDGVRYYKFILPDSYTFTESPVYFVAEYAVANYNFGYSVNGQYTHVGTINVNTTALSLPDSATALTGYKFNCWYLDINGNGKLDGYDIILEKTANGYKVPEGETIPLGEDLIAYADFDPIEYKVYFLVDGDLYGEPFIFTIENNRLVLPTAPSNFLGRRFEYWEADLDGDGIRERITDGTALPLNNVHAYAVFSENEYDVSINVDGEITVMPDGISVTSTYVYLPVPKKLYHNFTRYYLESDENVILIKTEEYQTVGEITYCKFLLPHNFDFTESAVCFVAVFTPADYKFGYYVNGRYTFVENINVNTEVLHLPDSAEAYEGYRFHCWYLDINRNFMLDDGDIILEKISDGVYDVPAGYTIPLGENLVAYAYFETLDYRVYFYSDQHIVFEWNTFTVNNRYLVLPGTTPTSPSGYHFEYWEADLDGDGVNERVYGGEILPLTMVKVYAKFGANVYSVSTNVDGNITVMPDGISLNSTYVYLNIPNKLHYSFIKYYLDGNSYVVLIKTDEHKVVNGVTYYRFDLPENFVFSGSSVCFVAEYTPTQYSLGYYANGVYTLIGSVNINTTIFALPDSVASTHVGYEFSFWYIDVNKNGVYDGNDVKLEKAASGNGYKVPENLSDYLSDLTICADFDPIEYKVYFIVDDRLYGDPFIFTVENNRLVLPAAPTNPLGLKFEYWEADLDGDGVYERIYDETVLPLNDVHIRARFSENEYDIYTKVEGSTTLMPDGISVNSTFVYLPVPEKLYYAFTRYYLEGNSSVVLIKTDEYKTVDGVTYCKFNLPDNFDFAESAVCFVAEFTPVDYKFGYSANGQYTEVGTINVYTAVLHLPDSVASDAAGYAFDCWYLDINKNGKLDSGDMILEKVSDGVYKVPAGKTIPLGNDLVAYAAFKPIEYTVYFHTDTGIVYKYVFTVNSRELVLYGAPSSPSGYHFEYWEADIDGDGVYERIYDGTVLPLSDVHIRAKFNESEYSVFIKVDGVPTRMPYGISISSSYVYLSIHEILYYNFSEYHLEGNRDVVLIKTDEFVIVDGVRYYKFILPDNYTFSGGSVYFVAVYSPIEYNFGYSVNGQYTYAHKISDYTVFLTLPYSVDAAAGYEFHCWYFDINKNGKLDDGDIILESTGDGYKVPAGKTIPLGEDLIAYADFDLIEYKVYFIVDDRLYGEPYVFTVENNILVLPAAPTNPLGRKFEYWEADLNGDGVYERVNGGETLPLGNVYVRAKFSENVYEVSTKVDGNITVMPDGISVKSTYVYLPLPEKLYHTFTGYYLEGNSDVVLIKTEEYKTVDEVTYCKFLLPLNFEFTESAVCFVARFTPVDYKFGYSANGQYTEIGSINANTTTLSLPDSATANVGYKFGCWYIDVNGNGKLDDGDIVLEKVSGGVYKVPEGKTLPLGEDLTVYANFDTIEYNIFFFLDNNVVFTSGIFTVENRYLVLPTNTPQNPLGYKFEYWEADLDGDGVYEKVNGGEKLPLTTVEIRAVFSENEYKVSTNVNGVITVMPDGISVNSTYVYLPVPARDHYNFVKYYLDGKTNVILIKTDEYKVVEGITYCKFILPENFDFTESAVCFVAEFTPITYTITYKDSENNTEQNYTYNVQSGKIDLPTPSPVTGKKFKGWYVDLDGNGTYETSLPSLSGSEMADRFGNITAIAIYEDIYFFAVFEAVGEFEGANVQFIYGSTALDPSLIPQVPAKDGYEGQWYVRMATGDDIPLSEYTLKNEHIHVYVYYEQTRFTVTFNDGTNTTKVTFNKGDKNIPENKIPQIPVKIGYEGNWYVRDDKGNEILFSNYILNNKDVDAYVNYTEIYVPVQTFNVTFAVNGTLVSTVEVPFGTKVLSSSMIPEIPGEFIPLGYKGEWESYVLNDKDITINAVISLREYTAKFIVDGKVIDTVIFTLNDAKINTLPRVPAVPEKAGYIGKWESYSVPLSDIEIKAVYDAVIYTATFVANGQIVAVINFTVNDTSITEPDVPYVEGYIGQWNSYTLGDSDIVIEATYTKDDSYNPNEPDEPDQPGTDDKKPGKGKFRSKKIGKISIWWILIIIITLIIIGIVLWIIFLIKKKDDDDDDDDTPEPPAVIPPVSEEPEEAPVEEEHIEIVEAIDVETADMLMSDDVAMATVETVGGAGVGMKSIVNVCALNEAFSDGDVIDLDALKAKKLVPKKTQRVKILADGILNKSFTIYAEQFSVKAIKVITLTGGKAIQKK